MATTRSSKAKENASRRGNNSPSSSSSSWTSKVLLLPIVLLLITYSVFVYDPVFFEAYTKEYEFLRPVTTLFQAVEDFSPFHEFISDLETSSSEGEKEEAAVIFTKESLKEYDGSTEGKGPYLAVLGQVFDVSSKPETYSPNGGYGFFSGRDGSRAFVTGEFNEEGLVDEVSGLTSQDYLGLAEWIEFYHKDYTYVGKVVGRFYDSEGRETPYKREVDGWVAEAKKDREEREAEKQMFPSCNSEWSKAKGHRVWCTNKSGGVNRPWIGRPRQLYLPGRRERCACVKDVGPPSTDPSDVGPNVGDLRNPHVREYDGCDPKATSCQLRPPEPEEETEKNKKNEKKP